LVTPDVIACSRMGASRGMLSSSDSWTVPWGQARGWRKIVEGRARKDAE
jgi:hypothetical protein